MQDTDAWAVAIAAARDLTAKDGLMRMSPLTARRKLTRGALLAGALLAASASTASAAPPTVSVQPYSPAISGNVGAPTAGVSVAVTLERGGGVVASAPTATTAAGGGWTTAFPGRALSNPNDVIAVDYSGAGAPADARYGFASPELEELFGGFFQSATVSADGTTLTVFCATCTNVPIPVHVAYAGGATASLSATPTGFGSHVATLSPAVGVSDVVTFTGAFAVADGAGDPTTLAMTGRAALPGQFSPATCNGDLGRGRADCLNLPDGSYELARLRSGAADATRAVSARFGSLTATFPGLRSGDRLRLRAAGATVAITTTRLDTLRVDATQSPGGAPFPFPLGGFTVTGGDCRPGSWLQPSFVFFFAQTVCPASGDLPPGDPIGVFGVQDDLSPGRATTTPPTLLQISPLAGENVYGPRVIAFADLDQAEATVALRYGPRGGEPTQLAAGNANSAAGAVVSGLVAGTRYGARWLATNGAGDTTLLTSTFNAQAGVAPGPPPGQGPNGPSGPRRPPAPRRIGVRAVTVTCAGRGDDARCRARVVLDQPRASVSLRLMRGGRLVALGRGTTRGRSLGINLAKHRLPVRGRRYDLTIVVTRRGAARTAAGTVRVR